MTSSSGPALTPVAPTPARARRARCACVFVLASAWVGAVAFCAVLRFLCCAPEPPGQIYTSPRDLTWRRRA
jgi:hypothetical protein